MIFNCPGYGNPDYDAKLINDESGSLVYEAMLPYGAGGAFTTVTDAEESWTEDLIEHEMEEGLKWWSIPFTESERIAELWTMIRKGAPQELDFAPRPDRLILAGVPGTEFTTAMQCPVTLYAIEDGIGFVIDNDLVKLRFVEPGGDDEPSPRMVRFHEALVQRNKALDRMLRDDGHDGLKMPEILHKGFYIYPKDSELREELKQAKKRVNEAQKEIDLRGKTNASFFRGDLFRKENERMERDYLEAKERIRIAKMRFEDCIETALQKTDETSRLEAYHTFTLADLSRELENAKSSLLDAQLQVLREIPDHRCRIEIDANQTEEQVSQQVDEWLRRQGREKSDCLIFSFLTRDRSHRIVEVCTKEELTPKQQCFLQNEEAGRRKEREDVIKKLCQSLQQGAISNAQWHDSMHDLLVEIAFEDVLTTGVQQRSKTQISNEVKNLLSRRATKLKGFVQELKNNPDLREDEIGYQGFERVAIQFAHPQFSL